MVLHSTLTNTDLHLPVGHSSTGRSLQMVANTANAYLIEDESGNDLIRCRTTTSQHSVVLGYSGMYSFEVTANSHLFAQSATTATAIGGFQYSAANLATVPNIGINQPDMYFNFSATATFAVGAISALTTMLISPRTYAFASASVISDCATLAITAGPTAGSNATITRPYAFWIVAGTSRFADALYMDERVGNPAAIANCGAIYTKDLAGVTQLYYEASDGTVSQISGTSSGVTLDGAYDFGGAGVGRTITATDGAVAIAGSDGLTITGTAVTSGLKTLFSFTPGAHTGLTASTENQDISIVLNRTVQWATGALASQRFVRVRQPSMGFVGASTCTTAATVAIEGRPLAAGGGNATLTNSYSLWLEGGGSTLGLGNAGSVTAADPIITWNTGNGASAFQGTATYSVTSSRGYLRFTGARIISEGSATDSTSIGASSNASDSNSTSIGRSSSSNNGGTAIGSFAAATGSGGLCFSSSSAGAASDASGNSTLVIAPGASSSAQAAHTRAYLIGDNLTSVASNETQVRTLDFIIGAVSSGSNPNAAVFRNFDATGATQASANLTIRPGKPTNNTGGSLVLQTTPSSGSNSVQGTPVDRLTISGVGAITENVGTGAAYLLQYASTTRIQINSTGIGLFNTAPVAQQTIGANVNNVAASGTTGRFDDFTDLIIYANDSAAIHASISQLARSVAQLTVAARNIGLGA